MSGCAGHPPGLFLVGGPRWGSSSGKGGFWAGSSCQLSINSRKRSCLAHSFGGWGVVLGEMRLRTGSWELRGDKPPHAGKEGPLTSLPLFWCLCTPMSSGPTRSPLAPGPVPTHDHSLCSFYFNQEVIKSIYSLKPVEKVKRPAGRLEWHKGVDWVSIVPGTPRGAWTFLWQQ
jgi:hypothetical protein